MLGFAGSIDARNDNLIRCLQAASISILQHFRAAVGVRFPDSPKLFLWIALAQCCERGGNLGGVVTVIVDDHDAILIKNNFHAALGAMKLR